MVSVLYLNNRLASLVIFELQGSLVDLKNHWVGRGFALNIIKRYIIDDWLKLFNATQAGQYGETNG